MLSTNIISKGTLCLNIINDQYQSHIIISCMACNACILLYDLWPVLMYWKCQKGIKFKNE